MNRHRTSQTNLGPSRTCGQLLLRGRLHGAVGCLIAAAALAGCEIVDSKSGAKTDSTRTAPAAASVPDTAHGAIATDSMRATPSVVADSQLASADSGVAKVTDDTTLVRLHPSEPARGGVVFALAEGGAESQPRCSWRSAPIPCYRVDDRTLVAIPLPADEDAGTFTLTIDRPNGRVVRQITVADRDFGRELIFLADSLYKLTTRTREIARDARAVRGIASVESQERRWSGRWREPLSGMKSAGYGVERFYYRATDSTRSLKLDANARTRGTFAGDTSDAAFTGAPSWRHAGVDIPAKRGTAVTAPAAGIVVDVGDYVLSGRTVLVDHGQGAVSAYFHLDTALVAKGDMIRRGQRIARVGATGLATGSHLHYGFYLHGKDVDPAAWADMPPWFIAKDSLAP